MKFAWNSLIGALVILVWTGASAEPLDTNDGPQPAACDAAALSQLQAEVLKIAGARNPKDAWLVVNAMLCGQGDSARSVISTHVAQQARYVVDNQDSEAPRILNEDDPWLQGGYLLGRAWGPSAYDREHGLWVTAWTSKFCWYHFGLQFARQKWRLVEVGGGCD